MLPTQDTPGPAGARPPAPYKTAIYWHFAGALPRMRSMSEEERKTVRDAAQQIVLENPVWLMPSSTWTVAGWGDKQSGGQVQALILCAIWLLIGEDAARLGGLAADWPDLGLYAQVTGVQAESEAGE
jgi:hypothetical protein